LLLCTGLSACSVVQTRFGVPVPSDATLGQLQPGVTTRAETVVWLGVPEEYRAPREVDLARGIQVQATQVVEERDLLQRRRLTWIQELVDIRRISIVPLVSLFSYTWNTHGYDRVVVTFDAADRVEHVAVSRELPL